MRKHIAAQLERQSHQDLAAEIVKASSASYNKYLMEADKRFLTDVAKEVKRYRGVKTNVKTGRSVTWLEISGEDRSDISFDATVSVLVKIDGSPHQLKTFITIDHAMTGRSDHDYVATLGTATPKAIAEVIASYANLK